MSLIGSRPATRVCDTQLRQADGKDVHKDEQQTQRKEHRSGCSHHTLDEVGHMTTHVRTPTAQNTPSRRNTCSIHGSH
eukprot:390384-Amphidinium_carterae.1